MKLRTIIDILEAEVLTENDESELDIDVHTACGSDMMSDVLAFVKDQGLLLTGLVNPQVVRTAEMVDIVVIAFVRGKRPDDMTVNLANQKGIILLGTNDKMYQACGKLYDAGLGR
ncbi:MAG: hypothetical protein HFK09_06395 [Clostridia bacterium]|nr:hypothetical protein [Clostridia bacterium]